MNRIGLGFSDGIENFWQQLKIVALGLICCMLHATNSNRLAAQDIETIPNEEIWQNSFHGFAELLRKKDVQLLSSISQFQSLPQNRTMLVAFGESSNAEEFIEEYLSQGGTVLLATDLNCEIRQRKYTIWIDGNRNLQARNNSDAIGGIRDHIIVSRFRRNQNLFEGVRRVATNRPSTMTINRGIDRDRRGEPLARYPSLLNTWSANLWDYPFLFRYDSKTYGEFDGRILAMPDHSVFNNAMLGFEDNLPFTLNIINWLKEGGQNSCLFFG